MALEAQTSWNPTQSQLRNDINNLQITGFLKGQFSILATVSRIISNYSDYVYKGAVFST